MTARSPRNSTPRNTDSSSQTNAAVGQEVGLLRAKARPTCLGECDDGLKYLIIGSINLELSTSNGMKGFDIEDSTEISSESTTDDFLT